MTREQRLAINRLERAVAAAKAAGLLVIADSDSRAMRIITSEQATEDDLRTIGETVKVHGACGGGAATSSGMACNYRNL